MKFEVNGSTSWITPDQFLEQSPAMVEQIRVREMKRQEARQNAETAFQTLRAADYGIYPQNVLNDLTSHIDMLKHHEVEDRSCRDTSLSLIRKIIRTDLAVVAGAVFPCADGMDDDHPDTHMRWRVIQGEQLTLIEEQSVQADRYEAIKGEYFDPRHRSFLVSNEIDIPLEQTWNEHRMIIGWDGDIDISRLELGRWYNVEDIMQNISSARRKHRIPKNISE